MRDGPVSHADHYALSQIVKKALKRIVRHG